jgi:hypothetical protein
MSNEIDAYLAKLKQAEEIALRFPDGSLERARLLEVAEGYRTLLKRAQPAPCKADTED